MAETTTGAARIREPRVSAPFRLAGLLVQPDLNRVVGPVGSVQVEPKVMDVLLFLVARKGEVVTKDEILERVWEGLFVTEDVLVRAVRELRKLFDDDAEAPRVIETIRKRGYRLLAPVEAAEVEVVTSAPLAAVATVGEPPRAHRRRGWTGALTVLVAAVVLATAIGVGRRRTERIQPSRFVPLTTLEGNEYDPALSPDGSRVAFGWDGGGGASTDLYVVMADGGAPMRLTNEGGSDRAAAWSPDGQQIAFLRSRTGACEVRTVSPLGGPSRKAMDCAHPHHPRVSWSPDGRALVASRAEGPDPLAGHIQVITLDTLQARDVTAPSGGGHVDTSPVFSPDGRRIAFLRQLTDSVGDLWVVDAAGGSPRRLTEDNGDIMGFAWTDGGRAIVMSSNRAGMYSLWRVGADGGEPELMVGGGRKMKHPTATRDGGRIVYEAWNYDMNLWSAPLGPGGAPGTRVAAATDEWTFEPQISPDGARLAFTSTRSGSYELWVSGVDGARPARVTSFGGPYLASPRWSPDGRRLAFVARPSGRAELYVVESGGGRPRRLADDPGDEVAPGWSADGRWIYFGSQRSGAWQLHKVALDSGEVLPVTTGGGYVGAESPDGRWLYFLRLDVAGLWRRPVAGGPALRVADDLWPEDAAGWGFTANGVYWTAHPPGDHPPVVRLLGPEGPPRVVADLVDQAWPGVSVSFDGTRLVYSRLDHRDSNLVQLLAGPARK